MAISSDTLFERLCTRFKRRKEMYMHAAPSNASDPEYAAAIDEGRWWFEPDKRFNAQGVWV